MRLLIKGQPQKKSTQIQLHTIATGDRTTNQTLTKSNDYTELHVAQYYIVCTNAKLYKEILSQRKALTA